MQTVGERRFNEEGISSSSSFDVVFELRGVFSQGSGR
jgi:hypothetical protein